MGLANGKAPQCSDLREIPTQHEPLSDARTPLAAFLSILLIFRCSPSPTSGM